MDLLGSLFSDVVSYVVKNGLRPDERVDDAVAETDMPRSFFTGY